MLHLNYISEMVPESQITEKCNFLKPISNHIFQNVTKLGVCVDEDQERLPTFDSLLLNCINNHIRLNLLLIQAHARLLNYQNC